MLQAISERGGQIAGQQRSDPAWPGGIGGGALLGMAGRSLGRSCFR